MKFETEPCRILKNRDLRELVDDSGQNLFNVELVNLIIRLVRENRTESITEAGMAYMLIN